MARSATSASALGTDHRLRQRSADADDLLEGSAGAKAPWITWYSPIREATSWWFHLRRCTACGHIGCCDSSPEQHARAHIDATGHSVVTSFEPGEDWFYDFETDAFVFGQKLAPPQSRPEDQPAPGPAGGVPDDWQDKLHS